MAVYQISGKSVHSDDPTLPRSLAGIYGSRERPLCLCRSPGVEMYVAKIDDRFVIKRMPNSGSHHAAACDSYEPPPELSGLGQVVGSAIQENPDEGTTTLKLDFALTKTGSRSKPAPSESEKDSVTTDGNKLTLRGTLHYLWEEAGFNRWTPAMAGKRSWFTVRKFLMQAAEDKTTKGANLAGMLYVPESFNAEKKNEITQRRLAQMMRIATPDKGTRRLMLVVGEVKELAKSRYGHKIILKHLPDCHFMLNEDIHKRLLKRFDVELGLWDSTEGSHLMLIGTFGVDASGVASLEEAALMCVTENWIPFESVFEKMLIDSLTTQGRRFMKGMRYNLPSTRPLACAVTSDTEPEPTAMYVVPPDAGEDYSDSVDKLIEESNLASWKWVVSEPMPVLPPATKL